MPDDWGLAICWVLSCVSELPILNMGPWWGFQTLRASVIFQTRCPRGIGFSFQLAITTPRMNLIGYGTATAQS